MVALITDSKWAMDEGGQRENGRHKPEQYKPVLNQWMPPQQHVKDPTFQDRIKLFAVTAERDALIQERNAALSEKKAALAERDLAILQRDAAIQERNAAALERDSAIAALEYARENAMNGGSAGPPGCPAPRGSKHAHHPLQAHHHLEAAFHMRDAQTGEPFPISVVEPAAVANTKPRRAKRPRKDNKAATQTYKKLTKPPRKGRRTAGSEDSGNKLMNVGKHDWKGQDQVGPEDLKKQISVTKHEWKGQDLGLNQVTFDDSTMPIPVCSCTGVLQQCYKWGNGGWQSACCTTTLSMYPLPVMPNKRHARVGGRKMSGSAFTKLLSRLAAEGHDLSAPLDLKDHWAKHGTNRYITIK